MGSIMETKVSKITDETKQIGEYLLKLKAAYRTGNGDKEELIELIKAAMGKRTQRKFAEDMGVNVSSVSRILAGKVAEISDTLLAKIAVTADENSGVTLDRLMEAQGLVEATNFRELGNKFERSCRRIFVDELLKRKFTVVYPEEEQKPWKMRICDFEILTDAVENGGRWLVETKMATGYLPYTPGQGWIQRWIDGAMAAYYRKEQIGRMSIVVEHVPMFEQIKHRLSETAIDDEISVILISVSGGRILDEFVAPMTGGKRTRFTFSKEATHEE